MVTVSIQLLPIIQFRCHIDIGNIDVLINVSKYHPSCKSVTLPSQHIVYILLCTFIPLHGVNESCSRQGVDVCFPTYNLY